MGDHDSPRSLIVNASKSETDSRQFLGARRKAIRDRSATLGDP